MPASTFVESVVHHVRAGYQCLMIPTTEESRCEKELQEAAKMLSELSDTKTGRKTPCGMMYWDQICGLSPALGDNMFKNPVEALLKITDQDAFQPHCLIVFRDLHDFYGKADVRRCLRGLSETMAFNNKDRHRPIILLQPNRSLHPDLGSCVTTLEFSLPTAVQLKTMVDATNVRAAAKGTKDQDLLYRTSQSLRGLTSSEADNCLSLCLVRHGSFVPDMVSTIEDTKATMLKRSSILTYTPREKLRPVDQIGGYDNLMSDIRRRALAYTPEAEKVKLDMPKGIVLIGVPGVGKSAVCECIASLLGLPLVNFDFSSVFASHVGESEQRTRDVIEMAKSLEGCVLVIDEADKSMGGTMTSTGDNGVSRRVMGQILTWLASKDDRTFVIMTMNRTEGIPPELLRKGRSDQIWYVDIPTENERKVIFEIHMRKRKIDPSLYSASDWSKLLADSHDMVGSEIEEAVKTARFASFDEDQSKMAVPSAKHLLDALDEVGQTRVTVIDAASIQEIREFGSKKARPVSSSKTGKRKRVSERSLNLGIADLNN